MISKKLAMYIGNSTTLNKGEYYWIYIVKGLCKVFYDPEDIFSIESNIPLNNFTLL